MILDFGHVIRKGNFRSRIGVSWETDMGVGNLASSIMSVAGFEQERHSCSLDEQKRIGALAFWIAMKYEPPVNVNSYVLS